MIWGSNPGSGKGIFFVLKKQAGFGADPASNVKDTEGLSSGTRWRGGSDEPPHLLPRLRMSGAILPLPYMPSLRVLNILCLFLSQLCPIHVYHYLEQRAVLAVLYCACLTLCVRADCCKEMLQYSSFSLRRVQESVWIRHLGRTSIR
jgi:hypothetical protein